MGKEGKNRLTPEEVLERQRDVDDIYQRQEITLRNPEDQENFQQQCDQVVSETIATVCKAYPDPNSKEKLVRGLFVTLEIKDRVQE